MSSGDKSKTSSQTDGKAAQSKKSEMGMMAYKVGVSFMELLLKIEIILVHITCIYFIFKCYRPPAVVVLILLCAFLPCRCMCSTRRTSRVAWSRLATSAWMCASWAWTACVPCVLSVDRKCLPQKRAFLHFILVSLHGCFIMLSHLQLRGLRADELLWWDVHPGEGRVSSLGLLEQLPEERLPAVLQARQNGKKEICHSSITSVPFFLALNS